jgi:hypothetical protein
MRAQAVDVPWWLWNTWWRREADEMRKSGSVVVEAVEGWVG